MSFQTKNHEKFYKEFIKLYQSQTALWKCGSNEYKNRRKREQGFQVMLAKFRELDPTANVDTVKKKINNLRNCYRRIRGKNREALRLGMEPKKCQWLYFKYFKFLETINDSLEEEDSWSNCEDSKIEFKSMETSMESDVEENEAAVDNTSTPQKTADTYDSRPSSPSSLHKKSESDDNDEDEGMKCSSKIYDEQQFWIEFIKLYEASPALWKCGSDAYKNRQLKQQAIYDLLEKMREVEPDADVDRVKRKINNFRNSYRRILSRTRRAIRLGLEPDHSWVYYDHLVFLQENKNPLEDEEVSKENSKLTYLGSNCDDDKYEESDVEEENITTQEYLPSKHSSKRSYESPLAESRFKRQQLNDEADILGIGWAYQYRNLSETQKLFAKKGIDDILFEARLGTLHRHSIQINKSNESTSTSS